MRHTDKYKFNIIDRNDPFGPERLNENTQAVEDKLSALETAHAVDKSELQGSINSTSSALSAHTADITQHAFVKLATLNIKKGSNSYTFSGLSGYTMLMLDTITTAPEAVYIRFDSVVETLALTHSTSILSHGIGYLFPVGTGLGAMTQSMTGPIDHKIFSSALYYPDVAWNSDFTVTFGGEAKITIYGLKA